MASSMHQKHVRCDPHTLFYKSDGTGRDGYILKFNGGLFSQQMMQNLKPKSTNTYNSFHFGIKGQTYGRHRLNDKVSHYHSDGSGRDTYVSVNNGGRVVNYNLAQKQNIELLQNFRSQDSRPNSSLIAQIYGGEGYKTFHEREKERELSMRQTLQSTRLSTNRYMRPHQSLSFTPKSSFDQNNLFLRTLQSTRDSRQNENSLFDYQERRKKIQEKQNASINQKQFNTVTTTSEGQNQQSLQLQKSRQQKKKRIFIKNMVKPEKSLNNFRCQQQECTPNSSCNPMVNSNDGKPISENQAKQQQYKKELVQSLFGFKDILQYRHSLPLQNNIS